MMTPMNLLLFCTQVLVDYVPSSASSLLSRARNPHIYANRRYISEESLTRQGHETPKMNTKPRHESFSFQDDEPYGRTLEDDEETPDAN